MKENLSHINDIEKFNRNYFHDKICPADFSNFYNVLSYVEKIFKKIKKDKLIIKNLSSVEIGDISSQCKDIKKYISTNGYTDSIKY